MAGKQALARRVRAARLLHKPAACVAELQQEQWNLKEALYRKLFTVEERQNELKRELDRINGIIIDKYQPEKVEPISKSVLPEKVVMPVETGIQKSPEMLDSRLGGNDRENRV